MADSVGPEPEKTWTGAVVARLRPARRQLSDDEILEILDAVPNRDAAADLYAAKGVTLPMYCLWKAQYRHLSLEEFLQTRRQELWRVRRRFGVLTVAAILGGGGIVFGLTRIVQWNSAAATEIQSAVTPLAPTEPATPVEPNSPSNALSPINDEPDAEPGYKVQVAARPTVYEARVLVERLTSDGYAAYLFRAMVGNQEMFRVRVGPFDTFSEAEQTASRLQSAGYTDAWITR